MQELLERIRKLYEAEDMLETRDSVWTEYAAYALECVSQGDVDEARRIANLMRDYLSRWSTYVDWDSPDTEEKFLALIGPRL